MQCAASSLINKAIRYIIEQYDHLADVVVFHHADRYQWHNDDPLYDAQRILTRLKLPVVLEEGYVNLRCVWALGCPAEIRPLLEGAVQPGKSSDDQSDARAGSYYKDAFEELFPEFEVPQIVGVSCCAQFAVSGQRIRQRPRSDYERYRQWILNTRLSDDLSGRIFEYSWHSE